MTIQYSQRLFSYLAIGLCIQNINQNFQKSDSVTDPSNPMQATLGGPFGVGPSDTMKRFISLYPSNMSQRRITMQKCDHGPG